ncbi:hypothetical protein [Nostoc sp.]|uniref:hypothetical protein n=1 Tax=Nostoc sp. TaxID=1180 RepID=UPI002FF7CD54
MGRQCRATSVTPEPVGAAFGRKGFATAKSVSRRFSPIAQRKAFGIASLREAAPTLRASPRSPLASRRERLPATTPKAN